jgi:peptide/nickel transport system substrate-binding protein
VEFGLLGPIEVRRDGEVLAVGGPKLRAVLAILLLAANEIVSRDRLIDGLWGEQPPPSASHTLEDYVSRLRKVLGTDRIATRMPGYMVRVESGELDLEQFDRLVGQGRASLAGGDGREAADRFRAALAIWRGPALADVLDAPFASVEAECLERRRLSVFEDRLDADLALGLGSELISELERLVAAHPLRERLLGHLMLALYRSGRQADALELFRNAKARFADELGLNPGPALRKLERQILEQDPGLDASRVVQDYAPSTRSRRRRRLAAAGLAVTAAACAATLAVLVGTGHARAPSADAAMSQLVALNTASSRLSHRVRLPGAPAAIASYGDSLWLADPNAGTVLRVEQGSGAVVGRISVGGSPGAITTGGGFVWAASIPGDTVMRIDPKTETITQTIRLGNARAVSLAFGLGGLWVGDAVNNDLIEFDPTTGRPRRRVTLHLRPTQIALGKNAIWVADYDSNAIAEVDLRSGQTVITVHVGNGPAGLAVAPGAIWVVNSLDSTVSKVDPERGSIVDTIPVGSGPTALAVARGSVWVANQYSATVSRIDPNRDVVVQTEPVGGGPTALTAAAGNLWMGTRPFIRHRGGTLTLLHSRSISIDPALNQDIRPLQSDGLTGDGLMSYNHVGGPPGLQLVPDLAVSVPTPTDGGTTYTFRLRPGIRYSDGRTLHAGDFRRAIERLFRVRSWSTDLFVNIAGAAACAQTSATTCNLSKGIVTDNASRTVTFHLEAPDPDFLVKLTEGGVTFPIPAGTPFHDTGFTPIPGTGPYKIAKATAHEIRYVRNPFFREWSHAAQPDGVPDEIVWRIGLTPEQAVRAIERGRADFTGDPIPTQLMHEVRTRFAGQLRIYGTNETDWLQFNTTRPPFDDIRVRRALNLAIDRRVIVRIYGGADFAAPTCQVIPPGLLGYRRYCPYTRNPARSGAWTGPDLARARRLVAASGTRGARVTVWGWTDDPIPNSHVVTYTARVLRRLGYRVRIRLVTHDFLAHPPAQVFRRIQLIPTGWEDLSANNFFVPWLSCRGTGDHGWFCDPHIDHQIQSARALSTTDPQAEAKLWARIDREIVDQAAWVPLVNPRDFEFVSARVHNYQHQPYGGMIADQIWLR